MCQEIQGDVDSEDRWPGDIDDETFADAQHSDSDDIVPNNIGCEEIY